MCSVIRSSCEFKLLLKFYIMYDVFGALNETTNSTLENILSGFLSAAQTIDKDM